MLTRPAFGREIEGYASVCMSSGLPDRGRRESPPNKQPISSSRGAPGFRGQRIRCRADRNRFNLMINRMIRTAGVFFNFRS